MASTSTLPGSLPHLRARRSRLLRSLATLCSTIMSAAERLSVEALALGRDAIGVDISKLAEFVAKAKTTVYSEAELDALQMWSRRVGDAIHVRKSSIHFAEYAELGYYKHLDDRTRWRLRKAIEQGLGAAIRLPTLRLESFGRCAVLRTAQWALDGRARLPSLDEFRDFLRMTAEAMVEGARALRAAVQVPRPKIELIHRSAAGLEDDERLQGWGAELWPKVGEGVNRGRRHIVGVFEPPLLHRRSDMPCPTITLSN